MHYLWGQYTAELFGCFVRELDGQTETDTGSTKNLGELGIETDANISELGGMSADLQTHPTLIPHYESI